MAQFETYSESAQGVVITRDRAIRELRDHHIESVYFEEGLAESHIGGDSYDAGKLLEWLGY